MNRARNQRSGIEKFTTASPMTSDRMLDLPEMKTLRITNSIFVKEKEAWIELNVPRDFIYDLDGLYVAYNPELNYKAVIGKVPQNIIDNMNEYSDRELLEYVNFLEEHLETFCSGKKPEDSDVKKDTTVRKSSIESESNGEKSRTMTALKSYKFNTNNAVTPNVKIEKSTENILMFMAERINIKAKCNRCQVVLDLESGHDDYSCSKCNQSLEFVYIPVYSQNHLGFMHLKGCSAAFFDKNKYQFMCEECTKCYETTPIARNSYFSQNCFQCHKKLRFHVGGISWIQQKKVSIKEGEELPKKGTCKHYPKSYRWFRFPCCGSLYPCDVCHNEDTNHEMEYANKMVCGLCSKEQGIKAECDCGMSLKKKSSQFWEGGKGNRNKSTLSRKDSRKYTKK
ncbi:YNS9 [Enterospora canceri]|uniref:YNS9 n=1 Tax=Enterospora canceri TaxID=1081671 RepID=A0A1Y1S7S5_9MICR|nr:YNS9 [Enterospora canceri]